MKIRRLASLPLVAFLALLPPGGSTAWGQQGGAPANEPASGTPPAAVSGYAWIRPQGGVLVIAGPATAAGYRIAHLDVAVGDRVAAGQPLADLDVKAVRAASLAIAQAQVDAAQVSTAFAQRELARKEKLASGPTPTVSRQDLDTARRAAQLAAARFEIARRQERYAQVLLDQATIRAPAAGMVLRILKHAGEGFTPGQGLIELGRVGHMQAVAEVYDTDARYVSPGQSASFASPALATPVTGKVLRILPRLDPVKLYETNAGQAVENRVVRVIVDFGANPALTRMTGLQGIATIRTAAGAAG